MLVGVKIINLRTKRALFTFCLHCQVQELSTQIVRDVIWFQQECLLSNCIPFALAAHKDDLSSAQIHCLQRGMLPGSGNNWPQHVPTPIVQHLCHQSCWFGSQQVKHSIAAFGKYLNDADLIGLTNGQSSRINCYFWTQNKQNDKMSNLCW